MNAIKAQNVVNPAGQVGAEPAPPGQEFTYTVRAQGRLIERGGVRRHHRAREPGRIDRAPEGRRAHRARRAELHAARRASRASRRPSIGVYQVPGSNALATAEGVKAEMEELADALPRRTSPTTSRSTRRFR